MTDRLHIEDIDWLTIGLYLVLVAFGWLNIFAVSYNDQFHSILDLNRNYGDQFLWILATFVVIIFLFGLDHRFYQFFAYPIYGFSIFLLLAVLLFGTEVNNARSWFRIFGFNFQPSEFAKLATLLALARYVSSYNVKLWNWRSILILAMIIGLPSLLIAVQPDWGTALVFTGLVLLLYREGMPGWVMAMMVYLIILFLITLLITQTEVIFMLTALAFIAFAVSNRKIKQVLVAGAFLTSLFFIIQMLVMLTGLSFGLQEVMLIVLSVSFVLFLIFALRHKMKHVLLIMALLAGSLAFTYSVDYAFHHILLPHQQTRVNILLGKETDVQDVGYNLNQSKIAIGSGGFLGKGFLQGTQTKLNFVPEQSTDFIFCTIGEEWGFVGATLVILLFVSLLVRLVFLAERQKSNFARIYGYGVVSFIFLHFGINIAMTIGLFPVVGIPLPFFSYGGSSLLAFSMMLFIFIRLDAMRKVYVA